MSIMDKLFGGIINPRAPGQSAVPAQLPGEAAAGNTLVPGPNTPASDGKIAAIPATAQGTKSPLDEYKELFNPPKEGESRGIPNAVPDFALDPKQLAQVAGSIDYTIGISAEKLAAAFPGSDPNAIKEILNSVGKTALENNFSLGVRTIEGAMTRQTANLTDKTIPEMLRRQEASSLNQRASELFTNPATATIMKSLETQFADRFPAATPQEIRDHTVKHFNGMMQIGAREQGMDLVPTPKQAGGNDVDWDKWAGASVVN